MIPVPFGAFVSGTTPNISSYRLQRVLTAAEGRLMTNLREKDEGGEGGC